VSPLNAGSCLGVREKRRVKEIGDKLEKTRLYEWMLPGKEIETVNGTITNREWIESEVRRINKSDPTRQAVMVRNRHRKISLELYEARGVFHPVGGASCRK
jgi:hypothetical protein